MHRVFSTRYQTGQWIRPLGLRDPLTIVDCCWWLSTASRRELLKRFWSHCRWLSSSAKKTRRSFRVGTIPKGRIRRPVLNINWSLFYFSKFVPNTKYIDRIFWLYYMLQVWNEDKNYLKPLIAFTHFNCYASEQGSKQVNYNLFNETV